MDKNFLYNCNLLFLLIVITFLLHLNGCASSPYLGHKAKVSEVPNYMPSVTKNDVVDIQLDHLYQYPGGYRVPGTSIVFLFESTAKGETKPLEVLEFLTFPIIGPYVIGPIRNNINIKSMQQRGQINIDKLPQDHPFREQNLNKRIFENISNQIKSDIGCNISSDADLYITIWPTIYIAGNPDKASLILYLQSRLLTKFSKKYKYHGKWVDIYYHSEPYSLEEWSKTDPHKFVDHVNDGIKEVCEIFLAILQKKMRLIIPKITESRDIEFTGGEGFYVNVNTYTRGAERIEIPSYR